MITTRTVLGDLRIKGRHWKEIKSDRGMMKRFLDAQPGVWQAAGWDPETGLMAMAEFEFAASWLDHGSIVYELSHDIASMFALTTAPPFNQSLVPHQFFIIKVPRDLLPTEGTVPSNDTWLLVHSNGMYVVPDYDTTAELHIDFPPSDADPEKTLSRWKEHLREPRHLKMALLCIRHLSNLVHYLCEYRSNAQPVGCVTPKARSTFVVKPPRDVVVSRDFRDAARAAVASESIGGTRRALAHVVRGHWRNQPVGERRQDRRLTWIRPHKRGDESLGRVVQRIERLR